MEKGDLKKQKTFSGTVVSNKMKDTIVVSVERYEKHPKYQKYMKHSKRYKADDPGNSKKIGDDVLIEECRPISKEKHFKIIHKANEAVEDSETVSY